MDQVRFLVAQQVDEEFIVEGWKADPDRCPGQRLDDKPSLAAGLHLVRLQGWSSLWAFMISTEVIRPAVCFCGTSSSSSSSSMVLFTDRGSRSTRAWGRSASHGGRGWSCFAKIVRLKSSQKCMDKEDKYNKWVGR